MVDSLTLLLLLAVALIATLISAKLGITVAIIEIVLGIILGNYLGITSAEHNRAVRLAARIAKGMGAEVMLIHVIEMREMPTLIAEAESPVKGEEGRNALSDAAEIAMSEGMPTKSILRRGHAASQINKYAAEDHAHMIFTGTWGRGGATSLLLGSVSHGIMQGAKCPVVVVR